MSKKNDILNQYTDGIKPSSHLKEKVLESARLYILARDLGELFTFGLWSSDTKEDNKDK